MIKNKNIFMMAFIISMMILPCIVAESSYTFKQGEAVNLKIPVFDENNNPVNSSTSCFLTVVDKNQNYLANNSAMSYEGSGIYSYSILSSTLGTSYVTMSCSDGVTSGFSTFTIDVTPSGQQGSLGFFVVIMLVLAGLIVLGFSIKDGWFVILGGMGLIIFALYSMVNGIAGFKDDMVTWGISITMMGVGAYLTIKSALEMMQD